VPPPPIIRQTTVNEWIFKSGVLLYNSKAYSLPKLWKQPRCPTTNKWVKKMWYLYAMECYSATNKNEIFPFSSKWTELENIILSEVSQVQRPKIACPPSYVDYRPQTNAAILLDMGHTLRGERAR
jgi:hypothetical protein